MIRHNDIDQHTLLQLIRHGHIRFAGNNRLKIYGKLNCTSGKRMMIDNRVFFSSIEEAEALEFRPCGHCLRAAYREYISVTHPDPKLF